MTRAFSRAAAKMPRMMTQDASPPIVDPSVRQRLMTAATELFDQKGYATTTVREIVESAGVTKPVLYYHFGSKEGIYLALFQGAFAALNEVLAGTRSGRGSARQRILDLCAQIYAFHADNLPLVRVMHAIYYGPPQGAPPFDFDATHKAFQDAIRALVVEGMASGELRALPPDEAMWAVVGALNIVLEVDLCHPDQSLGPDGLARLVHAVFDGLATPPHPAPSKGRAIRFQGVSR